MISLHIMHSFNLWPLLILIATCYLTQTAGLSAEPRSGGASSRKSLCSLDCSEERTNLVCGSDDVTYRNMCHLHQANACLRDQQQQQQRQGRAQSPEIRLRHRGECVQDEERCLEERRQAIEMSNSSGIPVFTPVCKEDGSYVPVQCHYGTGYCWCVNAEGKPVPGSSIRYDRPDCRAKPVSERARGRRNKGNSGRNGSGRKEAGGGSDSARNVARMEGAVVHRGKECTQSDRTEFSSDVLELLKSEFRRVHGHAAVVATNQDREIVEWKFDHMDVNRDGILRKREFRTLRLSVKQVARNKVCASNFWAYCDMDADRKMTKNEWSTCLGFNVNIPFRLFQSLTSDDDQQKRKKERMKKRRKEQENEENEWTLSRTDSLQAPALDSPSVISVSDVGNGSVATRVDCWAENRAAIESSRDANHNAYVPECTHDGRFQVVQCYKSSGYCWCVEELTGRPVSGTSVHNAQPDCDAPPVAPHLPMPTAWKKCPDSRRAKFQRKLMDMMTSAMVRQQQAPTGDRRWDEGSQDVSLEEHVAKWQFDALDLNKDGLLSRRELRPFRQRLSADEDLQLCGKRLQMHCDSNADANVSRDEWKVCVGVASAGSRGSSSTPTDATKRRGPNPLKTWLKDD